MNKNNPIVELALFCQKTFKQNIVTEVIDQKGRCHEPVITVKITLPNGRSYTESGSNQKIAKQKAAQTALDGFFRNTDC